jgi:choloylglycine hydrolase
MMIARSLIALAILFSAVTGDACTTFCTRGLFGRNYDFEHGNGIVVVNKRGMQKTSSNGAHAEWTSKFGSLTFNQFGRDNPTGGMNEKGLVVELMWLDGTRYPSADARRELGTLEWIQYQLDTSASVAGVIASDKSIRIEERGVPLHYLVADASGDVASIEFLDGKMIVHRGSTLPVPALANDTYETSLALMKGGAHDRFARAANALRTASTIDDAFGVLERVQQPETQWSIVYDIRNRAVAWRTAANHERRTIRFASLDFACASPVRIAGIDAGKGDFAPLLRDYTSARNLELVRRSIRATSFTRNMPDAEIEESAAWPDKSSCAAAH